MDVDEGWTEMFDSIWKEKGETFIQFLLDAGLDVNALNSYGKTMLSYAAELGYLEMIEFLVQNGADGNVTNSDGSKPLHVATKYGRKDIVKFFLDKGTSANSCDNKNYTPLHYVSLCDHYVSLCDIPFESCQEIVHLLIDSNADLEAKSRDGTTPLLQAAISKRKHIFELLMKLGANVNCRNASQWTVLHLASLYGWLDIMRSIVEERCDIDIDAKNSEGQTPLMFAVFVSQKDIAMLLIKFGADIECCSDHVQRTVLHFSCFTGCLDIVKCLVKVGCNLNAKDIQGHTPLVLAAMCSRCSVTEYLIDSGADLGISGIDGRTVLHFASEKGWLDVVKSLIKRGSDINVVDNKGNTPLHLAVNAQEITIISCLLKAGADWNLQDISGKTAFHKCILNSSIYLAGIILFIENGAYFQFNGYDANIYCNILQNVNLCTQSVINQFNNFELPKAYEIPVVVESLPSIDKLKIASQGNVARDIAERVTFLKKSKGYCDLKNFHPNVLSCLCIRSLVEYYDS